jgi:hypothetical protein
MKLQEVFKHLAHLEVTQTRVMQEDYIELVFLNRDFDAWHQILVTNLGEPRKPAGLEPNASDQELTSGTGGIRTNQTLFERCFGQETVIAKFWPWQDEVHTTLKMAILLH